MATFSMLNIHIWLIALLYTMPCRNNAHKISALFIFGDSTVDSGNNNWRPTIGKCNFKPYGTNFPGKISTGRFTDGKLFTDILSEQLGLPDIVPACLDPEFHGPKILTGASFATGGSGLYDGTAIVNSALTLEQQVNMFKHYKDKVSAIVGTRNASNIVSNGLFVLSSGTVDFTNVYYMYTSVRKINNLSEFQRFLLKTVENFAEMIYEEGGRHLIVLGLPPFGCLPSQITLHNPIEFVCVDYMNQAAVSTNKKLESLVESFDGRFAGLQAAFVNIYDLILDISQNPFKYGFEEARKGCCGTGLLEVTFTCNPTTPTCVDATKFVFWDSFHPSSATYNILAHHIMQTAHL